MDVVNVYQYSKLNGTDAIRLIYLQPCEDLEAGVECSLRDASLSEYGHDIGDHYIAISYVWGDQSDIRSILVDGKRLNITASLDSALRHVRDARRVLRVWADGVCINQKDIQERNKQVRLMGDVYSTAQHTIIFLGASSPECDAVFQFMGSELRFPRQVEESLGVPHSESSQRLDGFERAVENEILSKPWFTRVWILQELVLSQNPWIQRGRHRLKWDVFCRHVLLSPPDLWRPDSRAVLTDMSTSRFKFTRARDEIQPEAEGFPGETLVRILRSRRGCALSDPRDMVYAHLGLVSHEIQAKFPIDYNKSVAQVYYDIAIFFIERRGLKFALSLVDHVQPEDRPSHLPSWVTDWSTPCAAGALTSFKPFGISEYLSNPYLSWPVPGALAVLGYDCGTVNQTISLSTWPETEVDRSTLNIDAALQLLSQSDDKSVIFKQQLLDLAVQQYLVKDPKKFWRDYLDHDYLEHDYLEHPRLAEDLSRIRALAPSHPEPEDANMREARVERFVNAYLVTLNELLVACNNSHHVAITKSGAAYRMPRLAQSGDILVTISYHEPPFYFEALFFIILRPQNSFLQLELPEETDNMSKGNVIARKMDGGKRYQAYKFVASMATPERVAPWYFDADEPNKKSEKKDIFVLI